MMKSESDKIRDAIRKPKPAGSAPLRLSSGSTMVNLACSGDPSHAFLSGYIYMLVGDSGSGKTWLTLTTLAEAAKSEVFKGYRLIHDIPERGALMSVTRYFGGKLQSRIEPPNKRGSSRTSEEFYDNVDDAVRVGTPFIYVLDSEDALSSEAEIGKARANKKARTGDGQVKGSYGDGKAKKNSSGLRVANIGLEKTNSILIVIKQTRDNIGWDATFNPKVRSGGRALTFYATLELWFSKAGKIKKTVKGKPRHIGDRLKVKVKKNRVAGREPEVILPFYPGSEHGIDETGSLIDYMVEEGVWKLEKGRLIAPDLDYEGTPEGLVQKAENEGLMPELKSAVIERWADVEAACSVKRKRRYE